MSGKVNQATESFVLPIGQSGDSRHQSDWLQVLLLAALILLLYSGILARLASDWWNDSNYSHGFFVPMFSAFVLWQDRRKLASLLTRPSWFGLVVVAGALLVLIAGVFGAELFLSRLSFLFLLAGLLIYFRGWGYFRAVLFPWAILLMMIPIPVIVFNQVALPLQFLASQLAGGSLALLGVPVLREGNLIHLPSMTLEVAEACSGIRSLVSLVTLAIFYGYFFERRILHRVLLVIAAVPIAVAANGLRIMGAGLLGQYWNPDKAQGFFHVFSGWVIFVLALGMLYLFHVALSWLGKKWQARNS